MTAVINLRRPGLEPGPIAAVADVKSCCSPNPFRNQHRVYGFRAQGRDDELQLLLAQSPHKSRALLNANDDTRRVFSSRIRVRVIGGSARWLQFSRSQSRQLTPIGVPSAFSRSIPVA
jgi:hypothetical protein